MHEIMNKWEAYSEGVQGVPLSEKENQLLPSIVTARLKSKIPKENLKEIHKKDAGEIQEKTIIQLIQNKTKIEKNVCQKKIQQAKKWYVFSR